jgi:dTDP-4-dehydrorhamnose 3,5-epimerase
MGHSFVALEPNSTVIYLTDTIYNPQDEVSVNPFDSELGIGWNLSDPIISDKDLHAMSLHEFRLKYAQI